MFKRIVTGTVLIAVIVGLFFLRTVDARFFHILPFICSVIGGYEMLRALGDRVGKLQKLVTMIYAVAFVPFYVFLGMESAVILTFAVILIHFLILVLDFDDVNIESVGLGLLATIYPTLLLLPTMLLNDLGTHSQTALLLLFFVTPFADTFAYFIGTWIKGPKFSPKISPKKTISGAIGGLIGGAVGAVVVWAIFARGEITESIAFEVALFLLAGLVCSVLTELGDLVEGAIKRKLSIKDMGNILPGHGGVLDRIDGFLFSSAFIYVLFAFFR